METDTETHSKHYAEFREFMGVRRIMGTRGAKDTARKLTESTNLDHGAPRVITTDQRSCQDLI